MQVATLHQWAGILGSWHLLDETVDHLTGNKTQNGILHTQPASKKENIDRQPLQGLCPTSRWSKMPTLNYIIRILPYRLFLP